MIDAGELPNPLQRITRGLPPRDPAKRSLGTSRGRPRITNAPPAAPLTIVLLDGLEYFRMLNELPR